MLCWFFKMDSGTSRRTFIGILLVILAVVCNARRSQAQDEDYCKSRRMDLVVVMDGTISMGYGAFDIQREFVHSILSRMSFGPQGVQLGIIQFSDEWSTAIEMEMGMHGRRMDVLKNVTNIKYHLGRRTLTGWAMHLAYEQFFGGKSKARPGVHKAVLLITDGKPADMKLLHHTVKALKDKNVKIVSVAIGSTNNYIQRFRYIVRSISSGYEQGFKAEHKNLKKMVEKVANQLCMNIVPSPTKGKTKLKQKCFQEKKDIFFALDGSRNVETDLFRKSLSFVSEICGKLDITPSLIHVGMIQYSDTLNTRIEFSLDQYTKYYQINESLQNIYHSRGSKSDLVSALSIIDKKVFNGENGDRISAEDYLLLFVNDVIKQSKQVLQQVQRLKNKGVHVIVVGLQKPRQSLADFYEKMATHPSDVNFLGEMELKHIVGDLTAITCRKVNCENDKVEKIDKEKRASDEEPACHQQSQDVLFMIDTTKCMTNYFQTALKFFTKIVKKLSIAATNTHVGMMTFGRYGSSVDFELGKYQFESDINRKILRVRQMDRWANQASIFGALRDVNKRIFNTSTGGHREIANDLILIATCGKAMDRYKIQDEVRRLKTRGVRIAVLDVAYKKKVRQHVNTLHDIASGAREIYPMDFRRASSISQALLDVQCKVEEKKVSPSCFTRPRKVLFMLDSSRGLGYSDLPKVLAFLQNITKQLYTNPDNIEIGLMHYSDIYTARYALYMRRRSLQKTLEGIRALRYRQGRKNYLGSALKYARKMFLRRAPQTNEDRIVIILAHNEPADPEKAFKLSERLRSQDVKIITVIIHTTKSTMRLNPQYRALASSRASAHSVDLNTLVESSIDVMLNMCELNTCPKDSTKDCSPRKQDIFMIIDSSRSIGVDTYPQLRRFVRRLVNKLDVSRERTQIGILQASDRSRTQYEMKLGEYTNPKEIESVISEMAYHRGRASFIGKGLDMSIEDNLFNATLNAIPNSLGSHSDRADAENVLMVYSDGVFHDENLARRQIEHLKTLGVRVVVVGLGRRSRKPRAKWLLESMSSSKSDVYLVNLKRPSLMVEEELNEVAQHVTTLECENIYPVPPQCQPESLDLFVVVDGSRSVGYENFGKIQNFLKKLADEFAIGKNDAHFGVLQYGNAKESRIEFNLNDHLSNAEVSKAIENMKYLSSKRTDTGHALDLVHKKVFNGTGVDRPGVPNILILFTDGVAHDIQLAYRVARDLKADGTRIIAIGAGKQAAKVFKEIKRVASSKEDAHQSKFSELSGIVEDLLDVVCR